MTTYKKITEIGLLGICLFLFWKLYVPISTLTSWQNENNAEHILTSLDMAIPYFAYPIWAYHMAFLIIPISLFILAMSLLNKLELVRGFLISFVVMISAGYVIYFIFPVSVILYKSIPTEVYEPGFFNQVVLASYARIAPWNEFPSMHVATGWYTFRAIQTVVKSKFLIVTFFIWFLMMTIGALTLYFHSLAGVFAGLLLAECCFRWGYYKHVAISTFFEKASFRLRMAICLMLIGALLVTLHYAGEYDLHQVTLENKV
jgi:hypothetical protein